MAERRMFAISVIESDAFLDMPISARLLYFDLGMRGDDDGFVDSPKRVMRIIGVSEDDLRLLIAKQFLIPFDSGVVVVRHWKMHNRIRTDRYKPTLCQLEKSLLTEDASGVYHRRLTDGIPDDNQVSTNWETNGCIGKVRLGEVREVEDSKGEIYCAEKSTDADSPLRNPVISLLLNDKSEYPIYEEQVSQWTTLYPAVDVMQQLRNMRGWLEANPSRRKTKRGIIRFVNSWLARDQDKGGGGNPRRGDGKEAEPQWM